MDLASMTDEQIDVLRKKCLRSLFVFSFTVLGYDDIIEDVHGDLCRFLEGEGDRKQVTMPRSFVKTWLCSIAYPIWVTLPRQADELPPGADPDDKFWKLGPDMRILIASYVVTNAEKMIGLIRKAYESNTAMQILFPEVIPDNFKKTRWSNQSACINRPTDFTESTFEAAGIGGSATSRHYDLILEDDLIYAKKDDFSDKELQPSQEDIDKAIGWHKIAMSLLVPGKHTRMHNVGTRWAKHDLIDYIWRNEPDYKIFRRACIKLPEDVLSGEVDASGIDWRDYDPSWPEAYDHDQLRKIYNAQGSYMFSTQYLLIPISPEELLFKKSWLQIYTSREDIPKTCRVFTTVDVSEWDTGASSRKRGDCKCAILTCGWDHLNHMWIIDYDYERLNPTEVIMAAARHWKMYNPEYVGFESVYYQKSLAHFARQFMEDGKVPWMSIQQLVPEGNKGKDLRIRGLEPLGSNRAIHCRADHIDWINEFSEYIPTSRFCKKDLLDAAAYQIQIARPGQVEHDKPMRNPGAEAVAMSVMNADDLLRDLWDADKSIDVFGNPSTPSNPYKEETSVEHMLSGVLNPFEQGY